MRTRNYLLDIAALIICTSTLIGCDPGFGLYYDPTIQVEEADDSVIPQEGGSVLIPFKYDLATKFEPAQNYKPLRARVTVDGEIYYTCTVDRIWGSNVQWDGATSTIRIPFFENDSYSPKKIVVETSVSLDYSGAKWDEFKPFLSTEQEPLDFSDQIKYPSIASGKLRVSVGEKSATLEFANTSAGTALRYLLAKGDLEINMNVYSDLMSANVRYKEIPELFISSIPILQEKALPEAIYMNDTGHLLCFSGTSFSDNMTLLAKPSLSEQKAYLSLFTGPEDQKMTLSLVYDGK